MSAPVQEIEVQLCQIGQGAPIARIVYPANSHRDVRGHRDYRVESLSMRGAQREVTGVLISCGYRPQSQWERTGYTAPTWSRRFAPKNSEDAIEVLQ